MEELESEANGDPRIIFISRILSEAENIALKKLSDCYVSLHRSEGYGLNILESMGAGIPVIATNYGGNVDFFQAVQDFLQDCQFPIPYKLVTLEEAFGPYEARQQWAEPDHAHAVDAMIRVAQKNCKSKVGKQMSRHVYNVFGESNIGRKMQKLLADAFPRIQKKQQEKIKPNVDLLGKALEELWM